MFDAISARYDLANSVISMGRDRRWRRLAAEAAGAGRGAAILDCACGSGALARELRASGASRVVGLDFSSGMLEVARRRAPGVELVEGDVAHLPYGDAEFDAVTIGFGLRNLPDPHLGIREMARVIRPGGSLVILEAVRPTGPLAPLTRIWLRAVMPRLGALVSGAPDAYRYLGETVSTYASAAELGGWLAAEGLAGINVRPLMLGTVALVRGIKPAP